MKKGRVNSLSCLVIYLNLFRISGKKLNVQFHHLPPYTLGLPFCGKIAGRKFWLAKGSTWKGPTLLLSRINSDLVLHLLLVMDIH